MENPVGTRRLQRKRTWKMMLVVAFTLKPVGQMMRLVNPCSFTSFPTMLGLSISKVGWDKMSSLWTPCHIHTIMLTIKLYILYANNQMHTKAQHSHSVGVPLQAVVRISFLERKNWCFHGSLLLHHPCSFLSFYQRTWSQQLAKQTQALENILSRLDEIVGLHLGDVCSLTG